MTTMLAEHSAVPFHLGLTEPIDETATTDSPAIDGAYDPVEQIWKLPEGTPLTGPMAFTGTPSYSILDKQLVIDDAHVD